MSALKQQTNDSSTDDEQTETKYAVRLFHRDLWVTLHDDLDEATANALRQVYGDFLSKVGHEREATILDGNVWVDTVDGLGSDGPRYSEVSIADPVADALARVQNLIDEPYA
jgi:hypothetical protein